MVEKEAVIPGRKSSEKIICLHVGVPNVPQNLQILILQGMFHFVELDHAYFRLVTKHKSAEVPNYIFFKYDFNILVKKKWNPMRKKLRNRMGVTLHDKIAMSL